MSREYAENRIKEALRLSKGNPTRARQRIMAWTFEDPKLLQALARPHLSGIVAHAVGRVVHKQELDEHDHEHETPEMPETLDMEPETFGKEILAALQSRNTATFGQENSAPPVRRPQASKSHIDAMKQIASKGKAKKKDDM